MPAVRERRLRPRRGGERRRAVDRAGDDALSHRNHFTCDVLAEAGSAHIESLCKWGPATFIHRRRKLPSGRPDEEAVTLVEPDPTWRLEYRHFTSLCERGETHAGSDVWINRELGRLSAQALGRGA